VSSDINAAINAVNSSQFGLNSNLWTNDIELARKIARNLDTGGFFINGVTASDPRVPAGGVKNSGYGVSFHTSVPTLCKRTNCLDRERVNHHRL
jgi:acyl-CoA reductase-like NAD-dependent aldehyde dehydrogenase